MKTLASLSAAFAVLSLHLFGADSPALSLDSVYGPKSQFTARVDVKGIVESGFVKALLQKYPEIAEGIDENLSNGDLAEFTEITGISPEDLAEVGFSVTGIDALFDAAQSGEEPELGKDFDFVVAFRLAEKVDVKNLTKLILDSAEEEEGAEMREALEKNMATFKGATLLNMPRELLKKEPSFSGLDAELSVGFRSVGENTYGALGITSEVKRFFSGGGGKRVSKALEGLPEKRQVDLALPIPPDFFEEAGIDFGDDNPIFAGLANAVKGIREVGYGLSFGDKAMDATSAVSCADAQSALALWTIAQAGLGMAQLATAGDENAPDILKRIKTQAKGANVIMGVQVLPEDLDELGGAFGGGAQFEGSEEPDPEELIGSPAPAFKLAMLDGGKFNLASHKGKEVVVLDFWATWCGPCVKALPEVKGAVDALKDKGVVLYAVNQAEPPKAIRRFLKQRKWEDLNVPLDTDDLSSELFMVSGIPQTVIIDKEGVVRSVHVGYSPSIGKALRREIEGILKESGD